MSSIYFRNSYCSCCLAKPTEWPTGQFYLLFVLNEEGKTLETNSNFSALFSNFRHFNNSIKKSFKIKFPQSGVQNQVDDPDQDQPRHQNRFMLVQTIVSLNSTLTLFTLNFSKPNRKMPQRRRSKDTRLSCSPKNNPIQKIWFFYVLYKCCL